MNSISKTFNTAIKSSTPDTHQVLFKNFEQFAEVMHTQSQRRFLWAPSNDPRELLNNHLNILWSVHVSKFDEQCQGLIESINSHQFLLYGLIGRSFIEHSGVMRYYFQQRLQPTVDAAVQSGKVTLEQIQTIVGELDKFLRGSRFDWEAFFSGNFDKLLETQNEDSSIQRQVNILTCIQKWSKETPNVMVLYDLFCDLVHPNIGSTLLVMKTWKEGVGFGGQSGKKVGLDIVVRTLAGLVGLLNEVQKYLNAMLLLQMPINDAPQYDS